MQVPEQRKQPVLKVRLLDDRDAPAMRELFTEVFTHPMSPQFWHWKYRLGTGHSAGAFMDGRLVGHYGGIGADIVCFGKPERAVQIVDVMVSTSARHLFRTQSPLFLASSFFLERFIGYNKPYLLGYGFPNDRHMLLAQRLKLYAPVGRMHEIKWPATSSAKGPGLPYKLHVLTADNLALCAAKANTRWQALKNDMKDAIIVCKDAEFVRRRYLQNPDQQYQVLLLTRRFTGKPLGLIVLKQEAESMLLMDYIGPIQNLHLLLHCAQFRTARAGLHQLRTWCSERFVDCFKTVGAASSGLPVTIPANIWTDGPAPSQLHNRWWLMPGDTDFL